MASTNDLTYEFDSAIQITIWWLTSVIGYSKSTGTTGSIITSTSNITRKNNRFQYQYYFSTSTIQHQYRRHSISTNTKVSGPDRNYFVQPNSLFVNLP